MHRIQSEDIHVVTIAFLGKEAFECQVKWLILSGHILWDLSTALYSKLYSNSLRTSKIILASDFCKCFIDILMLYQISKKFLLTHYAMALICKAILIFTFVFKILNALDCQVCDGKLNLGPPRIQNRIGLQELHFISSLFFLKWIW